MTKKFIPSVQQKAYFDWVINGNGSCILEAVAGAGKTTTLVESLKLMFGDIFFGAYNKKIAEEIAAKAGTRQGLQVSTMHAAGLRAWKRFASNVKIESNKTRNIFREACKRNIELGYDRYEDQVLKLVSYAKQSAIGISTRMDDLNAFYDLVEHFDIEIPSEDPLEVADLRTLICKLARKVLVESTKQDHLVIDFDDMIYAPLFHNVSITQYDWVLIDEAQDTNEVRRLLALRMLKRGGRMVAVGDRHQAIYGFTGADSDALDLIAEAVSAVELPLTTTYRCPKVVVQEARKYVSHITVHDSAPEGILRTLNDLPSFIKDVKIGDAILCRFNAPLVNLAYSFIAAGIPAKVEGREIGAGLKALVRRWKTSNYTLLVENLEKYQESECNKFRAKEQESKAAAVEDKVRCLMVIIERTSKIDPKPTKVADRICNEIDNIFGDNVGTEVVLLSTIHKSKGREWERVYWLQTGPSKWARMEWEKVQENNLCYVAVTRAKQELILVNIPISLK